MEKKCSGCKLVKPLEDFAKNKSRSDGRQSCCRACKKIDDAKHYQANKPAQMARNRLNYKKFKEEIAQYKAKLGCAAKKCGEADPACLDFHHPSDDKEGDVANLAGKSKKKAWKEIVKCVVLCSNCHRKFHAGRDIEIASVT